MMTGGDDATYLLLSQSLRHGRYADAFLVGSPNHILYPPGYPAALAFWTLFGKGFDWLLVLSVLASVAAVGLVYDMCRRRFTPGLSLALLCALAVSPALVEWAGRPNSEALFTGLSVAALWAATRDTPRSAWAAVILGIAAALTRSIGVVILPAIGLAFLLRKRLRVLTVFVVLGAGSVGTWQLHTLRSAGQGAAVSYATDLSAVAGPAQSRVQSIAARTVANVRSYAEGLPYLLALPTVPGTDLDDRFIAVLILVGIVLGLAALARTWPAVVSYVVLYGGVLVIWRWTLGRFVVPLAVLLVPLMVVGWSRVGDRIRPNLGPVTAFALAALLSLNGLRRSVWLAAAGAECERGQRPPAASCLEPEQAAYFRAVTYLRDSTPPSTIVWSSKPATVYYYTGRLGLRLRSADSLIDALQHQRASLLVLGTVGGADWLAAPALRRDCDALSVRTAFPPYVYVFGLAPDGKDGDGCSALERYHEANPGREPAPPS